MHNWNQFKSNLPHQQHPFSKRNWGNPLHSVCSYQAKMKPALAHHLVSIFTKKGDIVLDPFSGSGTIPFEASLMGRTGLGMDISLLGTALSNAKLMRATSESVTTLIHKLAEWLTGNRATPRTREEAMQIQFNGPLNQYFHPETFEEILSAREFLLQNRADTSEWYLVMACMLHILHGNRPYALSRNSHPITPYAPTGEYIYKSVIEKLTQKVFKSIEVDIPTEFSAGKCFSADITQPWPGEVDQVDAIITSPPFFDSTKFYMTNWMRYWFCGWSRADFDSQTKNFVEVTQKKSLLIYNVIFENCAERIKKDGVLVFHLGFSKKCDMASELEKMSRKYFKLLDVHTESVEHCESHGIRDKGSVTGHQYLILRK